MTAIRRAVSLFRLLLTPDPVMRKEWLGASRRWYTYFFRAFYVGILGLVVLAIWLSGNRYGPVTYSDLARMGRDLFHAFAWAQLVLVALGAVVLTSDMVSKEVRQGTLGVALLTPLGPLRIILGKWKSSMGYLLLFLLSGLPVFSIAVYLGGVDWELFGVVLAIKLSMAVLCVSLALWVSTWVRTAHWGFVFSILLLVAYTIAPPLLLLAAVGPYRLLDYMWIGVYHPAFVLGERLDGGDRGLEHSWAICAVVSLALALALVRMAAWRTGRLGLQTPSLPLLPRLLKRLDMLFHRINPGGIVFGPRRTGPYDGNPLLWKELHFRATGRLRYFTRISLVLLLLGAIVLRAAGMSIIDPRFNIAAAAVAGILLLLSAIGAGSATFTKEKEEGKWDNLLTTPLTAPQFVFAKLMGALVATGPALLLYLLSVFPAFVAGAMMASEGSTSNIFRFLFVTLLFFVFVILASSWFSLWCSTTRKAFGLTLILVIFILVFFPFLFAIISELLGFRSDGGLEAIFYSTNPGGYFELLDWTAGWYAKYTSPPVGYLGIYAMLYLLACGAIMWSLLIPFDSLARRNA